MARNRMIKAEFWCDKKTNSCAPIAQLLFIGTWNFADDTGVCRADITYLQSNIFPYTSVTREQIEKAKNLLIDKKLIQTGIYNEEEYLLIKNFAKHQKIDRPSRKRYITADYKAIFEKEPNTRRVFDEDSQIKEKEKEKEKENVNVEVEVEEKEKTPTSTPSNIQEFKNDLTNWYGEYSNVYLELEDYKKGLALCQDKKYFDELIEEVGEAIEKGRYNTYDSKRPHAHLVLLKAFHKHRRLNCGKFKKQENKDELIDKILEESRKRSKEQWT